MARFRVPFTIRFYEVGPDGLASLPTIANLFQQAAGAHADTLGLSQAQLITHGLGWIMSRLTWEITRRPSHGENVVVETWPSSSARGLFHRQYRLLDDAGETLMNASSTWAAFDIAARKLGIIPDALMARIPFEDAVATAARPRALPKVPAPDHQVSISPRRTDLDLNGHVNNAQLVGWLLESMPDTDVSALRLLDIQFRRECAFGDEVRSGSIAAEPGQWRHTLVHETLGLEIARGVSLWLT